MRGVPQDRRKLYVEIREQAQVVFTAGISATKEELDAAVEAFVPGSQIFHGIQYYWKLARFPYFGLSPSILFFMC